MNMGSDIDPGHQPRRYYTPAASVQPMSLWRKLVRWFRATFRKPRGYNAVMPGLPPERIGTGYGPAYFPTKDKAP